MPTWTPNRNPVVFDYAAAQDAVIAYREAARQLNQSSNDSARHVGALHDSWFGGAKRTFEKDFAMFSGAAADLFAQLLFEAARIENAIAVAQAEQSWRTHEMARWDAEVAAEHQAAEQLRQRAEDARRKKLLADR
jgi:uncharacterized protein YukE